MKFLTDLLTIEEGGDLTELPHDVMSEIQGNIRKGAQDTDQDWANALHLVQKAYEVSSVERPDPSMAKAWKQYEQNIQYACEQLAKYRGIDADWRMSASVFHEAMAKQLTFRVSSEGSKSKETYNVKAKSMDDIVDAIQARNTEMYDVEVKKADDGLSAVLLFSKFGIKKNYRLKIQQNIRSLGDEELTPSLTKSSGKPSLVEPKMITKRKIKVPKPEPTPEIEITTAPEPEVVKTQFSVKPGVRGSIF